MNESSVATEKQRDQADSLHYRTWSAPINRSCNTNCSLGCSINRYYDPSTDQFLSIDPAVSVTNQPYIFVNDDSLNSSDPLGLKLAGGKGKTANVTTSTSDGRKITTITTTSSKGVTVSISVAPYTVPVGMGVTATISATVTISEPKPQSAPSLNLSSDGSVGVNANGVQANILGSGGSPPFTLSGGYTSPSGVQHVGGDTVTTNVSVTFSYSSSGSPFPWAQIGGAISAVGTGMVLLTQSVVQECEEDPQLCIAIAAAGAAA